MESLLDGLYHEKKAGGFFMKYLEKLGNEVTFDFKQNLSMVNSYIKPTEYYSINTLLHLIEYCVPSLLIESVDLIPCIVISHYF